MENYFKDMKAKLLERENTTLQELAILDSAMNEVLTAKIPETDKVKLAKFVSGMQERDRSRLKILSERKELVSRILEVLLMFNHNVLIWQRENPSKQLRWQYK